MIELGHRPTGGRRFATRRTRGSGSPRPTLRGSSTTAATCRTSISRAPSTTGTSTSAPSARRRRLRDARLDVEYHAPARFDDLLEVFVRVERIGTTSVTYDHAAYKLTDAGRTTS